MSFEADIKRLREEHSLTQQELADKVHVSRQTVSTWERGKNYPSLDVLRELSQLFGLSFEKLVFGEEQMTKKDDTIANRVDGDRKKKKWYKKTTVILSTIICAFFLWVALLTFGYTNGVDTIDRMNPFLSYQTAYTKMPSDAVIEKSMRTRNGKWTAWFADNLMGTEWWKLSLMTGVNTGYQDPYVMVIHKGSYVKVARIVPGNSVNQLTKNDLQSWDDYLNEKGTFQDQVHGLEVKKIKKKKHVSGFRVNNGGLTEGIKEQLGKNDSDDNEGSAN
ncbi:helix-turn-helix transcriptional regulator [Fructobacillus parabroussonetiae]|uniref:Helix-turn-helix transcriptional regulator n=1 Tax=Fructobacillus parabroussonetiae TaxID=2713174 RepID=A0ABS5QZA3_9LACO|nr:helix-turn-helix transcriptional regulator [Fructobacillus parabroussonetiae]MBS9337985.1 helix-turn-helix transcriptional regulator [Fructobacillus parabroussonetiae]